MLTEIHTILYLFAEVSYDPSSLLASGSDDQTAIIWDAVAHRTKLIHRTGHSGNIFSVKVSNSFVV